MRWFFEYPAMLALAPLLACAVAVLVLLAAKRRAQRLTRLGGPGIVERLVPAEGRRSPTVRALVLGTAAAFAAIAAAGPRWGTEVTVVRGSGADIVLALDASLSMLANDVRPNRLEKMRQEARRLLASSGGDRFGLIAFAGRSYILTPLTVDRGALELYLDNLGPSVVGQAGSSVARAIRQGTDLLLTTETAGDRALIVMSDGEAFEPESDIAAAAERAAEAGITLVTVGFGTTSGSTIPLQGSGGISQKRDENGEIVVSRYHPEMLRAAADAADGVFIDAAATDKASRVRRALASLRREGRTAEGGRERRPQFQLFLIPAVLLMLLDTLLAERRRARVPVATAALALIACTPDTFGGDAAEGDRLFLAGRHREAAGAYERAFSDGDASPRLLYNLGTAALAAGDTGDAMSPLQRAAIDAREPEVRFRALFNLGLAHLRVGRAARNETAEQAFAAALEAYKGALRMRPHDFDAKWNYELALREQQSAGGGGGGGGGAPPAPQPQAPSPEPAGAGATSLRPEQAAEILSSAAREEREVQGEKQRQNRPEPPPVGKDW